MATRQSGRACYLGSTMMKRKRVQSGRGKREAGFSLIEVLFATVILMVGLLAMLATVAYALATTQSVQEDQIAKQTAEDALENIFTARDRQQMCDGPGGGIFGDGRPNRLVAGPAGLAGTGDVRAFTPATAGCPAAINPLG